jgi:hypothetical protein
MTMKQKLKNPGQADLPIAGFDRVLKEMLLNTSSTTRLADVRRAWARWQKAKRQGIGVEGLVHLSTAITDQLTGTTLDQYKQQLAQHSEGGQS